MQITVPIGGGGVADKSRWNLRLRRYQRRDSKEEYRLTGGGDLIRGNRGKRIRRSINYGENARGRIENDLRQSAMNFGDRAKAKSGIAPRALGAVDGVSSRGDSQIRRSVRNQSENKPTGFECGNTDRFDEKRPIWRDGTKRWANPNKAPTKQGGNRKVRWVKLK